MAKAKTTKSNLPAKPMLTQEDVPSMLDKVNERIATLKGGIDEAKHTDGHLDGLGNIFDMEKPENLIRAYASINDRERMFNEAVKELYTKDLTSLGIKVPTFTLKGASADQWRNDIRMVLAKVVHKEELGKLEKVRDELSKHVSAEERLNQSLLAIQDIIQG
jgi:hypothetical protein